MKRDRKRQIRDYSKFYETDKEYYGLFRKKDKLRIDVKRLAKSEIVSSEIITQINNIPRNTAYFFPEKKKRLDYNCNIFRSDLDSLLSIWNTEIFPIIKNIRTPCETEHKAYVGYMSDGIMDHDESYAASIMKGIRRIPMYNSVLDMIYGQYIHLIGSAVEYSMIKVLEKNEHSPERIDREVVNDILKHHYNIKINEIPMAKNYNRFYTLWNFLKHNSISSYKSIKKEYPEILVEEPFRNGKFALWYVNLEERVIVETLNGLKEFFDSFCESVFGENLGEADWNYDEYFLEKYVMQRRFIENPLDLP